MSERFRKECREHHHWNDENTVVTREAEEEDDDSCVACVMDNQIGDYEEAFHRIYDLASNADTAVESREASRKIMEIIDGLSWPFEDADKDPKLGELMLADEAEVSAKAEAERARFDDAENVLSDVLFGVTTKISRGPHG